MTEIFFPLKLKLYVQPCRVRWSKLCHLFYFNNSTSFTTRVVNLKVKLKFLENKAIYQTREITEENCKIMYAN